jgi:hypothetical protein
MPRIIINQPFPARLAQNSYATISVVDPEGRPKILRVAPGAEALPWIRPEWGRDSGNRKVQLISVDLTTEREQAGCMFMQHAYEQEGFTEGWEQWQAYVKSQYMVTIEDDKGGTTEVRRERPAYRGHFPREWLPKRVLEMQASAENTRKGHRFDAGGRQLDAETRELIEAAKKTDIVKDDRPKPAEPTSKTKRKAS